MNLFIAVFTTHGYPSLPSRMNSISNANNTNFCISEKFEGQLLGKFRHPNGDEVLKAIRAGHVIQLEAWQQRGFDFHEFVQQRTADVEQSIVCGTGHTEQLEIFFQPFLLECAPNDITDPFTDLIHSEGMLQLNDSFLETPGKFEELKKHPKAGRDELKDIAETQFIGKKTKRPSPTKNETEKAEPPRTSIVFYTKNGRVEWAIPENRQRQLLKLKSTPRPLLGEIKCFVEALRQEFDGAGHKLAQKEFLLLLFPSVNYLSYRRIKAKMAPESILGPEDKDRLSKLLETPRLPLDKIKGFIKNLKNKLAEQDEKMSERSLLSKFFPHISYQFYKHKQPVSNALPLLPQHLLERAAELRQRYTAKPHGLLPEVINIVAEASRECTAAGHNFRENKLLNQLFPKVNPDSYRQIKKQNAGKAEQTDPLLSALQKK